MGWLVGNGIAADAALERYEFTQPHMGVPFTLVFYAADEDSAKGAAEAAFARVKQLNAILSDYDPDSEVSRLSATAGSGRRVPISRELWQVLTAAQALAKRSDGAFDVTVGPVTKLWRQARRAKKLPDAERLAAARAAVGFQRLVLVEGGREAELTAPGMRLDLGGIAKGYAADEALAVLRQRSVSRALVAAAGDIAAGEPPPDAAGWRVGIQPLAADAPPTRFLRLANAAVSTSGDLWQFIEIDGVRYSHIVDPQTGLGLTVHSTVTVVARRGIEADSLATAVTVLGPNKGLALIEATPGAAALGIWAKGEEREEHQSRRLARFLEGDE